MDLIKTIKTISNIIYIYRINNSLLAFKPSKNIKKEILVNKLAKLFKIKTINLKPFEIDNKKGILMDYIKDSTLLADYKKNLNQEQISQLKRIILFDIWIGNKDRHTANIFVNNNLTIFDNDKVFQQGLGRSFIKLDIGRKLNKNYVDIIEKLLDKNLTIKQVLKKLNFSEKDFVKIKNSDIRKTIKDKNLVNYLISRKNFTFNF
ncbi:MAG: hypothetical protein KKG75_01960 [Nanoarchaeota archaeon]|nr:hypothetical protein [Nanoarchaeota archaeon]